MCSADEKHASSQLTTAQRLQKSRMSSLAIECVLLTENVFSEKHASRLERRPQIQQLYKYINIKKHLYLLLMSSTNDQQLNAYKTIECVLLL